MMRGVAACFAAIAAAGCASVPPQPIVPSPPIVAPQPSVPARATPAIGYLPKASLVGAEILPPPPVAGSAAQAADDASFREAQRLRGTARWDQAIVDSDVVFPGAASRFACALGLPIDPESMPHLYVLVRRSFMDAAIAGAQSKAPFPRVRPFVAGNDPICTPQITEAYRKDPSYPSSNAAIGMAWALILAELAPERIGALMRRGLAYGDGREICGVHWQSDVTAGRLIGAAVVAQLHANPEFLEHFAAARREVGEARAAGKTAGDCAAEARALGN